MSVKQLRHWKFGLLGIGWIIISILFTQYNAPLYKDSLIQVLAVSSSVDGETTDEQEQTLQAVFLNGPTKGQSIELTVATSYAEATAPRYHKGDQLFIDKQGQETIITNVKRDRYVLILLGLFILVVWWVGQKQGLLALSSVGVNILVLMLAISLYITYPHLPLVMIMLVTGIITTTLSLILGIGWNKKTATTVIATLLASVSAWLIAWLVLTLCHDKGLRYEEMPFLTRPYRQIFIASLFLGTLGASMDIAITVVSTVTELIQTNPTIATHELIAAGKNVGKNVMGSMTSVLLFAYLSGGIPTIILYLKNDWDFMPSLEMTLSLEIARALVGAIGIVLTIPISVAVVSLFYRKGGN